MAYDKAAIGFQHRLLLKFAGCRPCICPAVIPGRREAAGPESRQAGIFSVTGFRARAFGAPRNDTSD
jgi:hypothetical protein